MYCRFMIGLCDTVIILWSIHFVFFDNTFFFGDPDYLQQAYEALLRSNGINIDTLRQCAAASLNPDSNKPDTTTHVNNHSKNRDSVVEHDDLPVTHSESPYEATEPLNCLDAVAYNIILRPQYMMLVPRSKKDFASAVNINSFGTTSL